MEIFLKTRRLYLRGLQKQDETAIHACRNDPACYRYQRWEDTSRAAVRALIEDSEADVFLSEKEEQHYAICVMDGRLVGDLSYFYTERDRCVTLGITIASEHHRKGYAFELLREVVAAVQQRHPKLEIVALIHPENAASITLFEKLGFCRECYAESIASYVYVIGAVEE